MVIALDKPIKPAARSTKWMLAGPNSIQAHRIETAGRKLLVTACKVALLRSTAVGATSANMRCFECMEISKEGNRI